MAKCPRCGNRARGRLTGAKVCSNCWFQVGLTMSDPGYANMINNPMTVEEFNRRLDWELQRKAEAERYISGNLLSLGSFGFIGFNDVNRKIIFKRHHPDVDYVYHYETFGYDQLCDVQVVDKSRIATSSANGLERAAIGGLLFGRAGAVVGATTANQSSTITSSQDLIIYMRVGDGDVQQCRVPGNQVALKKLTEILSSKAAQASTLTATKAFDDANAILRFKELLDAGVITEDEFSQKKAQILGL